MTQGVPPSQPAAAVKRLPLVSLLLAGFAIVVQCWPGAAEHLQLDRAAFSKGEIWRLVTCHFTHFGENHLLWDVLAFLVLGCIGERRNRSNFLLSLAISILLISLTIVLFVPSISFYRGLSGLDSALLGLLATDMLVANLRSGRRIIVMLIAGLLTAFAMKIVIEMLYGVTVFVDNAGGGFVPVPLAHVVGLCAGLCVGLVAYRMLLHGPEDRETSRGWNRPGSQRPVA